jgi:hypothetical protein
VTLVGLPFITRRLFRTSFWTVLYKERTYEQFCASISGSQLSMQTIGIVGES